MIKNFYKGLLIAITGSMILTACTKKPVVDNTTTVKMGGEWFVEYFEDADPTEPVSDFTKILSYNTSDPASNKLWVEDADFWPFKAKMDIDYSNLGFKAMDATDNVAETGEGMKIYEGKIIPSAGHSKSGNVVDSIYLKVEFTDDAGTIYQIRGHQRTGFFEDEY